MSFLDACLYSLAGILVVFFALILLMCIIKIMTAIGDRAEKKAVPVPAAPSSGIAAPDTRAAVQSLSMTAPLAPGTAGEFKLYNTDPRDAAMVMAIVADSLGKPINELRFISIREVKEDEV